MALVVVSTTLPNSAAFAVAADDDLLITRTGAVIGTAGATVELSGQSDLIVEGLMAGGQIDLLGGPQRVTVAAQGSILSTVNNVSAFRIVGDAVVDNAGLISATGGSGLQVFGSFGSLDLLNAGRLTARDAAVFFQFGGGGTVSNSGSIEGGSYGVYLETGSAEVTNTGTISGGLFGVLLLDGDNTVSNQGTISGGTGVSVGTGFGTDLLLANAGRIAGVAHGVWLQGGAGARIENDGVISGAIGIRLGDAAGFTGANGATIVNSGTIQSDGAALDILGTAPTLINTGTMGTARMGAQGASVTNRGDILGGVAFTGTTGTATLNALYNAGTITAGGITESGTSAVYGSGIAEAIVNTGTLAGGLLLDGGNDLYLGGLGRVTSGVSGAAGDDTLEGGALAETLDGGAGSDLLSGGGGDDFLQAGSGLATDRDVIDGGAGNDVVLGSAGLDLVDGGDGNDTLFGNDNADTIDGGAGRDELYGNSGADVLEGGEGADLLQGDVGADVLSGGDGNDVINGNADADTIDGGAGDDRIRPGAGADLVDGGEGLRDILDYIGSLAVNVNLALGEVFGGDAQGDDVAGFEWAAGGNGNDTLTGDGLANGLFGSGGNDLLVGAAGNDTLAGDAGADTLNGGAGVDVLRGGLNADVFRFIFASETGAAGAIRDRIADFSKAQADRIDVSFIDANAAVAGNQAFAYIGAVAAFSGAGQLRSEVIGGDTYVSGNTDAVLTTAEFSIRLIGAITLAATDFIL
jgi:Ca2+-binding RTX toxin-like protein